MELTEHRIAAPEGERLEVTFLEQKKPAYVLTSMHSRETWAIYRVEESGKLKQLHTGAGPKELEARVFG